MVAQPELERHVADDLCRDQDRRRHAENALPQRAKANVNCRILPGTTIEAVQEQLTRLVADPGLRISLQGDRGITAPVPPLTPQVVDPAKRVAARIWPGVPLVPTMTPGATDGRLLNVAGTPTYGLSGLFHDAEGSRAHGLNERTIDSPVRAV